MTKTHLYLAPMEGVLDDLSRDMLANVGGIDRCVTEFIRVTDHRLPRRVYFRMAPELNNDGCTSNGTPVFLQLLGCNPETLASSAAKAAELGAPGIDLNFGCPAKTVNRHRGGAVLLDDTELLHRIVKAVREAVPKATPVTVKIRLGVSDNQRLLDNAHAINDAGANQLCIHARSKADAYRPPAHWECIARVREVLDIPIVANGDIWSLTDYQLCKNITGCEHFMLGRGMLARPDLALAIRRSEGEQIENETHWADVVPLLIRFQQASLERHSSLRHCGDKLKQWLVYLSREYSEAEVLFEEIKRERTPEPIDQALQKALINANKLGLNNPDTKKAAEAAF